MVVFILAVRVNRMAEMLSYALCKIAALFISVIAPMLGVFLVIRRQSLMRYPFTCVISRCGTRLLLIGI